MHINIEVIVSVIVAIFASNGFWQYLQTKTNKKDVKTEAILALLHDKLYYLCDKQLSENNITVDELENIECLYQPYTKMGGNGTVELLYEKVKKLPHK